MVVVVVAETHEGEAGGLAEKGKTWLRTSGEGRISRYQRYSRNVVGYMLGADGSTDESDTMLRMIYHCDHRSSALLDVTSHIEVGRNLS